MTLVPRPSSRVNAECHLRRKHTRGAALPACLALAGLLALLTLETLTTAQLETQLISTASRYRQNFVLAEGALADGLALTADNPAEWPATAAASTELGHTNTDLSLRQVTTDSNCPAFTSGERRHFELRASLRQPDYRQRHHLLGFTVCMETCTEPACLAAIDAPVIHYWTIEETG